VGGEAGVSCVLRCGTSPLTAAGVGGAVMLSLSLPGRVFVCTLPTDMRRSFDSLAGLVQQQLGQDPLSGDLFVFRSRRGDRVKLLWWDQDDHVTVAPAPVAVIDKG